MISARLLARITASRGPCVHSRTYGTSRVVSFHRCSKALHTTSGASHGIEVKDQLIIRLDKFDIGVSVTKTKRNTTKSDKEVKAACGDLPNDDQVDDEMEQEEMFVDADDCLGLDGREWGGPRRGGRLPEPTRFGDWERKGRCTDF